MLQQLLWKQKNKFNLYAASVGAVLGLLMLLAAVQLFLDIQGISRKNTNFVLVNKKLSLISTGLSMLGGEPGAFGNEEIAAFAAAPSVRRVAPFKSNQCRVQASVPEMGFFTDLFFQALPADMLDVQPDNFRWSEGEAFVPIILSYDYLALYNFAFAPSMNLPPFTTKTVQRVKFNIRVFGKGLTGQYTGQIVGFSRNINSILVPLEFLEATNARFGDMQKPVKQIYAQIDNPGDPRFRAFLEENNYEVSKDIGDRVRVVTNLLTPLVSALGLVISLLSLLIFVLSFRLFVSDSAADIRLLLQLGYKVQDITQLLSRRFMRWLLLLLALVMLLLLPLKYGLHCWFTAQGFESSPVPDLAVWALALFSGAIFLLVIRRSIQRSVSRLFS
jgi:hypothetical protein